MANEITLVSEEPTEGLTEEEQDSLAVGEELAEAESQLLAGKYENAEELERAYIELQKKLGGEEEPVEEEQEETEEEEEQVEISAAAQVIGNASAEFAENGQLSEETMAQFNSMSSQELVNAYIESQANAPQQQQQVADLSEADVNSIKNYAGGEESYQALMQWAGSSLPTASVEAFDNLVETGNTEAIRLAVAGLRAEYDRANGVDGELLTGKAPTQTVDVFRSQAEVVRAMSDPRYDNDPAYRQDIFDKLDRSNNVQW